MNNNLQENLIEIYESNLGELKVDVRIYDDSVWLSLNQMSELFDRDKSVISRHLKNVFTEGELEREAVVAKNATTASDGKVYEVEYFNLDAILSVGYRINSKVGTRFRRWASNILKKHLIEGYSLNREKLMKGGISDHQVDYEFDQLILVTLTYLVNLYIIYLFTK